VAAYKLIAVDVDGTLLTSNRRISARTRGALARAHDGGAALAVATGRRRRTALPIVEQLGLPHFLVASQGATVWQGETLLTHSHLPAAAAWAALEIIRRHGLVTIILGNSLQEEVIWVDGDWRSNRRVEQYLLRSDNARLVRDFSPEAFDHDPIQFILMDTLDRLERLDEALTGHAAPPPSEDPPAQAGPTPRAPLWRVIFSVGQFTNGAAIEVVGPETSKAAALAFICREAGIGPEQVVAFGDNVNDVEMLAFAGLGVAMGNATPDACAAADRIAPANDEDGIAAVLEELGLA
jgi:hydroxymethylpyrimidine pyrophosphatase-like HAD family hydrolase